MTAVNHCPDCGKIIQRRSKHCASCSQKGERAHLYGKHRSKESRIKQGLSIRGSHHHNWKGGKYKNCGGYVLIYMPEYPRSDKDGYVLEHRLVIEQSIGRYLSRWELVHHLNETRDDNRLENLFVCTIPEHLKLHKTMRRKRKEMPPVAYNYAEISHGRPERT